MTIFLCAVLGVLGLFWVGSGIHIFAWGLWQLVRNVIEGVYR